MTRQFLIMLLAGVMGCCAALTSAAEPITVPEASKTFFAEMAAKAEKAEKANAFVLRGKDNWLFFTTELKSLGVGAEFWGDNAAKVSHIATPDAQDSLAAILDFKAQCDKAGVELILVPVPAKATIYPDFISEKITMENDKPAPRLDVFHEAYYKVLRDKGINVIDLTPAFLEHRDDADGLLYCKTDTHWSGLACVLTAQLLAEQIKERPWLKDVVKHQYEAEQRDVEVTGDLAGMLDDKTIPKEKLKLTVVNEKTAAGQTPIDSWRESPVVLLGDSHNLIFHGGDDMLYKGAGLADQLAMQLGFPVDLVAVRGSGATPARRNLARRKDNLAGKKLVIWCFTTREFTEGQGWSKVTVVRDAVK